MTAAETTNITMTTVNRAKRMATEGQTFEIRDTVVKRLSIRGRSGSAAWTLRLRIGQQQTTRVIAFLDQLKDPDRVRALARQGKELGLKGEDPADLFSAARIEGSGDLEAAQNEAIKRSGTVWTWEILRDRFIEDTKEKKRKDTHRCYKSVLNQPDFDRLKGKLITQIESKDLQAVRKSMADRGVATQAGSAVRTAKSAFSFAVEHPESGLKLNPVADVKAKPRTVSIKPAEALNGDDDDNGGRPLSEFELGSLLWEMQKHHNAAARISALFLFATLQRRLTCVQALKEAFRQDEETGLFVWTIHAGLVKGGRPHEIPLPPLAKQFFESALLISKADSKWLFPQQRKRFKADEGNGHMNERTMNDVFYWVQEPGRLLAPKKGASKIGPHDSRATFTSLIKEKHGMTDDDAALILHHSEGKGKTVTSRHYDRARELDRKLKLLTIWENHLRTVMDKYEPKDDDAEEEATAATEPQTKRGRAKP